MRNYTALDSIIINLGNTVSAVCSTPCAARAYPGQTADPDDLSASDCEMASRYMRINHVGEICAQALYQSQALTSRSPEIRKKMKQASEEEIDHLAWCEQRLSGLDSGPSKLNPIWYAGSFAIGAASGLFGDKWSLGFIAETERQVCEHLTGHLHRLPDNDERSRAIVKQMREEEQQHGDDANQAGAAELPRPVKDLMRLTSKIMTKTAYRV